MSPKSCSSGFRSPPSAGAGNSRSNGFDVSRINSMKPTATKPITASTRATMSSGKDLLNAATALDQMPRINDQSSSEPSCAPQTAANLKGTGNAVLELFAT